MIARLSDRMHVSPTVLLIAGAIVLFALAEVVIIAVLLTRSFVAPPPLRYTAAAYAPERADLCPGELLRWKPRLTVQEPGHIQLSRTFWDRARDRHALLMDGTPSDEIVLGRNYPLSTAGQVRENVASLVVPPLPPGAYLLITVASRGAGYAQYEVPFSVREGC